MQQKYAILKASLNGELFTDEMTRRMYATDASLYRELPIAVAYPKNEEDIVQLIHFATKEKIGLIPRTAGTSLAGQCVGSGIVVDTSHYMNKILHLDTEKGTVRVQPGVIRDELNRYLKPFGYFFGPNTSTANRAMIGGMVGNNSSGSYSIVYGVTRDHVLEIKGFLSDGNKVHFKEIDEAEFLQKQNGNTLENLIYRQFASELSQKEVQVEIRAHFPRPDIHRRNTGYALDKLLEMKPFSPNGKKFNLAKFIAGSEGTLMCMTEITLHLDKLPPKHELMIAIHYKSLENALRSVMTVMSFKPRAVELMDKKVLDCTKENREQNKNRFFIEGDPAAILMVEIGTYTKEETLAIAEKMVAALKQEKYGYYFPFLYPPESHKAMELRKAGLGLLSNIKGDKRPLEFVEDTAVSVEDLADYIADFDAIMQKKYAQKPVYYAHAGAGELHIRPLVNLKTPEGIEEFKNIAEDSAILVKKYKGSLSGEHGDGRVRAAFIPLMLGEKNYALLTKIKYTWDPHNIFNPGKIIDAPPIDVALKDNYKPVPAIETLLDFSATDGMLHAVEKCRGSADCRKLHTAGGVMCPSYMATKNEKDTTRARANILRDFLIHSAQENRFDHEEILKVMDLCISCKGCKSECPSNVDMAMMKAEFLYQYYKSHKIPFYVKAMANISRLNRLGMVFPAITNFFLSNKTTSSILKNILHVAAKRSLPLLGKESLRKWFESQKRASFSNPLKGVYFFADEFTNYNDVEIGKKALLLLDKMGYQVEIPKHVESGRAYISKGLLKEAQTLANQNFDLLVDKISEKTPLIGLEPSAILTFRDEFPRLVSVEKREKAKEMAKHIFLIDEFLAKEMAAGEIAKDLFSKEKKNIVLHGHCHQKALSEVKYSQEILSFPPNYQVEVLSTGCCGMAGSFGYEKDHYEVSMKIGSLVLFPALQKIENEVIIAAVGTSCRHQIADGVGKKAFHPIEILWEALV